MLDKIIQKGRKRYGEKIIVNAIVEQMEKVNLLNIEMKEYFTYSIAMINSKNGLLLYQYYLLDGFLNMTVQMMLFLFFFYY